MPRKSTKRTNNSTAWKAAHRLLRHFDHEELLGLLQELYHVSPDNAEIIKSHFQRTDETLLSKYRNLILPLYQNLWVACGWGRFPRA